MTAVGRKTNRLEIGSSVDGLTTSEPDFENASRGERAGKAFRSTTGPMRHQARFEYRIVSNGCLSHLPRRTFRNAIVGESGRIEAVPYSERRPRGNRHRGTKIEAVVDPFSHLRGHIAGRFAADNFLLNRKKSALRHADWQISNRARSALH